MSSGIHHGSMTLGSRHSPKRRRSTPGLFPLLVSLAGHPPVLRVGATGSGGGPLPLVGAGGGGALSLCASRALSRLGDLRDAASVLLLRSLKKRDEDEDDDDCWGWTDDWGRDDEYEKCWNGEFEYVLDPDEPPDRCDEWELEEDDDWGWFDICEMWHYTYGDGATDAPTNSPTDALSAVPSKVPSADPSVAPSKIPTVAPILVSTTLAPDSESADFGSNVEPPTGEPTDAKTLPEQTSIPLSIFSMNLEFFVIRERRGLLVDFDEDELEIILNGYLTDLFGGMHAHFSELLLVMARGDETVEEGRAVVTNTFTGSAIFSGADFSTFPSHADLESAVLGAFEDRSFLTRLQNADDPVLASVQIVEVSKRAVVQDRPDLGTLSTDESSGDNRASTVVIAGIVAAGVAVVGFAVCFFIRRNWGNIKKWGGPALNKFWARASPRASPRAKSVLSPTRAESSKDKSKAYNAFQDGQSEFSGLNYPSSSVNGNEAGASALGPLENDDSSLMNMSELGATRLGKVLQVEDCGMGDKPHGRGADFNDIWVDESPPPKLEDIALGMSLGDTAAAAQNVKGLHGSGGNSSRPNITMELLRDVPSDFRAEDSQSELTVADNVHSVGRMLLQDSRLDINTSDERLSPYTQR